MKAGTVLMFSVPLLAFFCSFASAQSEPFISEFQAINHHTYADAEGGFHDWMEIHNPGSTLVISGWFLTDDSGDLRKWEIPQNTWISSGDSLLIFASGLDKESNGELHTNFKLDSDGEYLALVMPDGVTVAHDFGSEYPPQTADTSYGIRFNPNPIPVETYFSLMTPGETNGYGGPAVLNVESSPESPGLTDEVVVEAEIVFSANTHSSSVTLIYRTSYQGENSTTMFDDGISPDQIANDGIWTGAIPAGTTNSQKMLRWRVAAQDNRFMVARKPPFLHPTESAEYLGTVMDTQAVTSELPILHWFCDNPGQSQTQQGTQCSVFFEGQFYDNLFIRRRGASSSQWPKKNFKFDFNRGDHFRFSEDETRVEEFNLNSTWSDKAYFRRQLCWDTYAAADVAASQSFMVRAHRSGQFYSLATFVEQPDEELLAREGLDPDGALYKMYTTLESSTWWNYQKKTRLWDDDSDIQELAASILLSGQALEEWLFDNVNIPAVLAYTAATTVMNDNDHVHKNYYLYRDSDGDQEWQFLPWDKDLTMGRNYTPNGGVLNDEMWATRDPQCHPLFGDRNHPKVDSANFWNRMIDACYRVPRIQEMYLRHLRSVMDETLQAPQTPAGDLKFESRIDSLLASCLPEVLLDQAKWGIPSYGNQSLDYAQAIQILKSEYLAKRRTHLYTTHGSGGTGLVPDAQLYPHVAISEVDHSPVSGNEEEEYVKLTNPHDFAVDISAWELDGGIEMEIPAGTVIPALGSVYLVRHAPSFRARQSGPTGGSGLFVVGDYNGHISPTEKIHVLDQHGDVVATTGDFVLIARDFAIGATARCSVVGAVPNGVVTLVYSLTGAGTTGTPWGNLGLAPPVRSAGQKPTDATGYGEYTATLPAGLAGRSIWMQAVDMRSQDFSEVVEVTVQ